MNTDIKIAAVDIDGTFVRSDYTYDVPRFKKILARMKEAGCSFVVASGNQYYQLRDLFPGYDDELSFVAENGETVFFGIDKTSAVCYNVIAGESGGTKKFFRHRRNNWRRS